MDNSNEAIAARSELNLRVVEALGWHVVKLDEPEIMEGHDSFIGHYRIVNEYVLVDGADQPVMRPWQTPELVLEHAPYPNYSEELEEAFKLFDTIPKEYTPRISRLQKEGDEPAFFWRAEIVDNVTKQQFKGEADHPAEAITRCWLNGVARARGYR